MRGGRTASDLQGAHLGCPPPSLAAPATAAASPYCPSWRPALPTKDCRVGGLGRRLLDELVLPLDLLWLVTEVANSNSSNQPWNNMVSVFRQICRPICVQSKYVYHSHISQPNLSQKHSVPKIVQKIPWLILRWFSNIFECACVAQKIFILK